MSKSVAQSHRYTAAEEIANALTHGLGAILSVAALLVMVGMTVAGADPYRIVGASVFGVTLILMYLASTLYHSLPHPSLKDILRTLDHCAIYLLIAGTYTPILLISMRGAIGWSLLVLMWTFAVAGCIFKVYFTGRFDKVSTALYVAMGWVAVLAIKPITEMVPSAALLLIAIGGLIYTGGVVFYLWDRLPYNHAIWHLFVLGGSAFHFFAITFFVLPVPEMVG